MNQVPRRDLTKPCLRESLLERKNHAGLSRSCYGCNISFGLPDRIQYILMRSRVVIAVASVVQRAVECEGQIDVEEA